MYFPISFVDAILLAVLFFGAVFKTCSYFEGRKWAFNELISEIVVSFPVGKGCDLFYLF